MRVNSVECRLAALHNLKTMKMQLEKPIGIAQSINCVRICMQNAVIDMLIVTANELILYARER